MKRKQNHVARSFSKRPSGPKYIVYHHCGTFGHLRLYCSKFHALKRIKRKEKLELLGSYAKKGKPVLSENNMLLKKVFNGLVYVHLWFSFFQPLSHFSWDTHSKKSFRLDEEGLLWLRFCSFGPWSNSFDLCRTFHALNVISSCILCILHFFLCIVCFFFLSYFYVLVLCE